MRLGPSITLIFAALLTLFIGGPLAADNFGIRSTAIDPNGFHIGGLSGLAVLDQGNRFIAISDRGHLLEGEFHREGQMLSSAEVTRMTLLGGTGGRALNPRINEEDAEGLAISSDGSISISFEFVHRISKYRDPGIALPYPALLKGLNLSDNAGLETLAIDDQDRLVTLPEGTKYQTDHPVLRLDKGRWSIIGHVHPSDSFAPVGADFGPDGFFYLLERRVNTFGFRSRIRRFDLGKTGGVFDGVTLWQSGTSLGNLEGLSIWTDGAGDIRATMVADDNFLKVLFGGFVEITLVKKSVSD